MVADEARITLEPNPYYVWHPQGATPIKKRKLDIHQGKSIFGALSIKKGEIIKHTAKKKNGSEAVKLLDKIKVFKEQNYSLDKKKILLIWDNVSCHKSHEVKEWLKDNPHTIELDNFPPYSPEMNPIEHIWKIMKKHINHLRGETTLTEIILEAEAFLENNVFNYRLFGLDRFRIFE